jgi:hypothetical protein
MAFEPEAEAEAEAAADVAAAREELAVLALAAHTG